MRKLKLLIGYSVLQVGDQAIYILKWILTL